MLSGRTEIRTWTFPWKASLISAMLQTPEDDVQSGKSSVLGGALGTDISGASVHRVQSVLYLLKLLVLEMLMMPNEVC